MTTEEKLILTPLEKALRSLEGALKQVKNEFTRDATIQRFEYSFELCWKMLKRYLNQETGITEHNIKNILREGGRLELIDRVEPWFVYLKARNSTSHTYNEDVAEETYLIAKQFLPDAFSLLENLKKNENSANN
jgi:nucleotidyltransferase substrate binding protein (TIGR01987 family)